MANHDLEKKFGLDLMLIAKKPKAEYCEHCRESTTHNVLTPQWQRLFSDPNDPDVDFRQTYEFHTCSKCQLLKFCEHTWCYELDEHGIEDTEFGEIVVHNMDREADTFRCYPPIFSNAEQLLFNELKKCFSKNELYFVEEVCTAFHAKLVGLTAIGIRSIIEKFYFKVGTSSRRDKFVTYAAKKEDGTSKTRNEYKYKLLWLESEGLISRLQSSSLHAIIKIGNMAAHTMEIPDEERSSDQIIEHAILAILSLAINYNQSNTVG